MQEIIAVIFDFDDTLAPDSTSGYLDWMGVAVPDFWRDEVQPLLDDDWDPVPAYLYKMIEVSGNGPRPFTKSSFEDWGRRMALHPGVETIFDRLRDYARELNPRLVLEFYLISSGIGEVLRQTRIAGEFSDIWASDFHYDDSGRIVYPKKIVSFTDKTRYIFQIQKGIFGERGRGRPFEVNRKFQKRDIRVPLDQMIVVGDGFTDIPCFSLVKKAGGVAIGVFDQENREKWGRAWGFIEDGRVSNLVPADYGEKSALTTSLMMALQSLANRVSLRAQTYQG
jgi:hypothetical protein